MDRVNNSYCRLCSW